MTKIILKVLGGAVFPVLMLVTACGAQSTAPETTRPPEKHVEKGANFTEIDLGGWYDNTITFVESPDGSTCAVASNSKGIALDCGEAPTK